MTPADHIALAEKLLRQCRDPDNGWLDQEALAVATEAGAHALVAIAVELGAPHQSGTAAAASGG